MRPSGRKIIPLLSTMIFPRLFYWPKDATARWVYVAQLLVGLFFIGAACFKILSFFWAADQHLSDHFAYWVRMNLPPLWYRWFMDVMFSIPYMENIMEATLLFQLIPGIMLVANYRTRLAGWLLLFIQIQIFLGTYNHWGFNEFVGMSLWIAVYFAIRPADWLTWKNKWNVLTFFFFIIHAIYLYNRYVMQDPWPSAMSWQLAHFQTDIVSSHILWKQMVIWIANLPFGAYLWAGTWWLELVLTLGILTKYRHLAGAGLVTTAVLREITWLNTNTSQGVLTLLFAFVWLVQEVRNRQMATSNS
jgi:hypothetical protein